MTDAIEVTTTIHAPREDVYALLTDVEGLGAYSEYVRDVTRRGDGGAGTEYGITLSWWRLSHTVWVRVTGLDPPARISWRLAGDLDARGAWRLEPTEVADPDVEHATRVTLAARYDPGSAGHAVSLPRLVPMSAVVDRLLPAVEREAERVLARVVADLEGEPRRATLTVRTGVDAA